MRAPSLLALAAAALTPALAQYGQQPSNPSFQSFSPSFSAITGPSPRLTLLSTQANPLFHEAAVYHPASKSLFVTSNFFPCPASAPCPDTAGKTIVLTRVTGLGGPQSVRLETVPVPGIPLPNGGTRYLPAPAGSGGRDEILLCAQGNLKDSPLGGIYALTTSKPYASRPLVTSFYGRPFNSPNDVIVAADGALFFTDPVYGSKQGVRPPPKLPNQVYRFDPAANSTRAVADGFARPNGIAFGVGEKVVYVTDTGSVRGDGTVDAEGPATIYAYDVLGGGKEGGAPGPFLGNRRVFAYADAGIPDGLEVDTQGNLYAGQGDGVAVFSSSGQLIGKILVEGGVANFAIAEPGVLFLLNEKRLFRADISKSVKNAAR